MSTHRIGLGVFVIALAIEFAAPPLLSLALAQDGKTIGEGVEATGEVALRYQVDGEAPGENELDHRFRLAARLGVGYRATDSITLFARLTSAKADDPRDGFSDIAGLSPTSAGFDRALVRWQKRGLVATAGLIDHVAGSSSIVWDRDLSPAGGTLTYSRRLGSVTFSPAAFAYLVRGDLDGRAAGVVGGELAGQTLVGDADIELAVGTYQLARKNALADSSPDNSKDADGNLAADFEILEGRLDVVLHQLLWIPIELSADVFFNPGAPKGQRTAFSARISTSQRRAGGVATASYRFRSVDRDAVLSALASDDFRVATHLFGDDITLSFDFDERVRVAASLFLFRDKDGDRASTPDIDEGELQLRGRADLSVRF